MSLVREEMSLKRKVEEFQRLLSLCSGWAALKVVLKDIQASKLVLRGKEGNRVGGFLNDGKGVVTFQVWDKKGKLLRECWCCIENVCKAVKVCIPRPQKICKKNKMKYIY